MNETELTKGCPKCGRVIGEDVDVCPYCGYKFADINAYFAKMSEEKFDSTGKYAGILKRIIALFTDVFFVGGLFIIIITLLLNFSNLNVPNYSFLIIFGVIFFVYKLLMEGMSSSTIGKKVVGIEVSTLTENEIGFKESIIRNIAIIFDFITLGIGFLMIAFSKNNVALHDVIAKTLVINSKEEVANDDYAPGAVRLIAFILDCAILYGLIYLIGLGFDYIDENFILPIYIYKYLYNIEIILDVFLVLVYFSGLESGSRGASIGKRLTGMRIETLDGKRMGMFKAFIRTLCIIIEVLTFGYLLCMVTNKKQTLKDKIVGTKVIRI